jgi:opacity protein-like surface antigen
MKEMKLLAAAVVAGLVAGGPATAADILEAPPPRIVPAPIEVGGGWYLRGDVGIARQELRGVDFAATSPGFPPAALAGFRVVQESMDEATILGAGVGYQFNEWLRFDLTGEYRTAQTFQFLLNQGGPLGNFNNYEGRLGTMVGLVNAYVDLGNFYGITPFVGVGIGFAHHRVTGFQDVGFISSAGGFGYAPETTSTEFAWAIHAGLSYAVTDSLKLELSYRYLDMGNVHAGVIDCQGTLTGCPRVDYTLRDMTSHDVRLGMRWMLGAPPPRAVAVPAPSYGPVVARN